MDGWMDGWMDGLVDGLMGGWINGRMDGWSGLTAHRGRLVAQIFGLGAARALMVPCVS